MNYILPSSTVFPDQQHPVQVTGRQGQELFSRYVVTCGGLHSDRLAKLSGCDAQPRVVPFRGEYLKVSAKKGKPLVHGNIYPVKTAYT